MKKIFFITAIAVAFSNPAIAHDVKIKGKPAQTKASKIVATEFLNTVKSLRAQGIKTGTFNISVDARGIDLNPENCCTIITPDDVTMECPCSE